MEDGNERMNDTSSKKASSPKKPEKIGMIKRFLDWIARGADVSGIGRTSCPT